MNCLTTILSDVIGSYACSGRFCDLLHCQWKSHRWHIYLSSGDEIKTSALDNALAINHSTPTFRELEKCNMKIGLDCLTYNNSNPNPSQVPKYSHGRFFGELRSPTLSVLSGRLNGSQIQFWVRNLYTWSRFYCSIISASAVLTQSFFLAPSVKQTLALF